MAAFAILFSLWSLVLSQDSKACVTDQCGLTGGSKDETSMVQVNVQSHVKSEVRLPPPVLADPGQSCQAKCGPNACDASATNTLTNLDLDALARVLTGGLPCDDFIALGGILPSDSSAPLIVFTPEFSFVECFLPTLPTTCSAPPPSLADLWFPSDSATDIRRACQCLPSADNLGDPHIRSFRGAHYTLLQQGVFIAWNFSKPVPAPHAAPAEWQLLAAYAGERFTTQGLLLLDPHAGSMEITAEDCTWRVKEEKSPWREAHLEQLSAEDGTTSFQVKKLHEKLGETKILRSAIALQMGSGSGTKSIASLVAHCSPQNHLDFKVTMFDSKDVEYVGGELGVAPDGNRNYHFFSKKSMVQTRADQEFKAPGSWVSLGGSPAGAAYLEKKQHTGASLMQSQSCSDNEEENARAICSKHLHEATDPETFADCVYDLCHGGDESFAQSAAAFLMPLDDSSA